jgi:hypothetical protein
VGLVLLPFSLLLGGICLLVSLVQVSYDSWEQLRQRRLNWVLLGLSLGLCATAYGAEYPIEAWLGLANFLPCFWFFAGFRELLQTPAQLRRGAWLVVLGSMPIALIGLGGLYHLWSGPIRLGGLVDWPLAAGGTPTGRMASVFAYANVLASYIQVAFALNLGLLLEAISVPGPAAVLNSQHNCTRPERTHPDRTDGVEGYDVKPYVQDISVVADREAGRVRYAGANAPYNASCNSVPVVTRGLSKAQINIIILVLALGLNSCTLVLTHSRNAWIVAFLTLLVFGLYQRYYRIIAFLLGLVASVFWAAFGPIAQGSFRRIIPAFFWARLTDQGFDRPVADLRITQWQFAWSMTTERPWSGWGLRNFTPLYEAQMGTWLGHPHSTFLMLSAETGIPLTLLLMGVVGWILAQGVQRWHQWRAAIEPGTGHLGDRWVLFTYLVSFGGCAVFSSFDVTFFDFRVNLLNWFLLAAIAGVCGDRPSPTPASPSPKC